MKKVFIFVVLSLCVWVPYAHGAETKGFLLMASTIGPIDSGIVDALENQFEKETGIRVRHVGAGTGAALDIARKCNVDLVMVHAKTLEEKFVSEGYGTERIPLMYNDFVIVGPPADPAGLKGGTDAAAGLAKIAAAQAPFISRGDASGTHVKEQTLWKSAGVNPEGSWYISAGQGMGPVLIMADEKRAYTLADRATYTAYGEKVDLAIVCEGDRRLFNPYSVIAVNPARQPHVKRAGAQAFIDYITSPAGQAVIAGFKVKGQQLFTPCAK